MSEKKEVEMKRIRRVENVIGYVRKVCLSCKKCKDGRRWKMVVYRNEKGVDLWGLECGNLRVIYGRDEK